MTPTLVLHITSGAVGILSGTAASYFRKTSSQHATAGNTFVVAMIIMALTGAWLGYSADELDNMFVGLFTLYLVITGWYAGARRPTGRNWLNAVALLYIIVLGIAAALTPAELPNGVVQPVYGVTIASALFAIGDIFTMVRSKHAGKFRIRRHLWRMGFAFTIALLSFFIGQPQVFPELIRETGMLAIPVVLSVVYTLFSLFQFTYTKQYRAIKKFVQQQLPSRSYLSRSR